MPEGETQPAKSNQQLRNSATPQFSNSAIQQLRNSATPQLRNSANQPLTINE
ncbi:MAG: hypothetical protein IPM42_08260 [Saprospiraceae bacterium]|nr:hypothetical protein [Saprospiraceae bacterium]